MARFPHLQYQPPQGAFTYFLSSYTYLSHSAHCARLAVASWRRLVSVAAVALGISCAASYCTTHTHTYIHSKK